MDLMALPLTRRLNAFYMWGLKRVGDRDQWNAILRGEQVRTEDEDGPQKPGEEFSEEDETQSALAFMGALGQSG